MIMVYNASSYYFRIMLDSDLNLNLHLSGLFLILLALIFLIIFLIKHRFFPKKLGRFEINGAEFGLGEQKLILRPNTTDLQIAYKIWVELSTRKIGLPVDLEHDVISEIYDSWYMFFSVTRELIKDVPVTHFRRKDTEQIIRLSIDVLNIGIRPHLTKYQARFRRWYEQQLKEDINKGKAPQEIQKDYPQYEDLVDDLQTVNERLIQYRQKMYDLITNL